MFRWKVCIRCATAIGRKPETGHDSRFLVFIHKNHWSRTESDHEHAQSRKTFLAQAQSAFTQCPAVIFLKIPAEPFTHFIRKRF